MVINTTGPEDDARRIPAGAMSPLRHRSGGLPGLPPTGSRPTRVALRADGGTTMDAHTRSLAIYRMQTQCDALRAVLGALNCSRAHGVFTPALRELADCARQIKRTRGRKLPFRELEELIDQSAIQVYDLSDYGDLDPDVAELVTDALDEAGDRNAAAYHADLST